MFTDHSAPRAPYFLALEHALDAAGIVTPTLVIDQDRLDANIAQLMQDLPGGMGYRVVAKSLPVMALLRHIRAATGTDRLMTFNLPMLRQISTEMPEADQLLGKPLTEAAARAYFDGPRAAGVDGIRWLIDTPERLRAYDAIARGAGCTLRVVLELDIGLHRGGLAPGAALDEALSALREASHLRFAGLMGYEPHLASVPQMLGWRDRAIRKAWALYAAAKAQVAEALGPEALSGAVLNAAGSPTYRLYKDCALANEVSVGSALVKPTDFDTSLLQGFDPACFIATPVVKAPQPRPLPVLERLQPLRRLDPNQAQSLFIHGGHWLAEPVDPPGLRYNGTVGRSSNQEMLTGGRRVQIAPGGRVFLRPHQSEAVLMQFGPIALYRQGQIVDHWAPFETST